MQLLIGNAAFVLPFISALGYDVFNPQEVRPEFTPDIGIKIGEKVDYAILKDDLPIILAECKHWKDALNIHDTQLLRYFNVTKAKFAILTNGINYRFYTEAEPNIMVSLRPYPTVVKVATAHQSEAKIFVNFSG